MLQQLTTFSHLFGRETGILRQEDAPRNGRARGRLFSHAAAVLLVARRCSSCYTGSGKRFLPMLSIASGRSALRFLLGACNAPARPLVESMGAEKG